ncbi:hypothetical protein, partial [Acinetobacter baumannii]|uniref:hypothetical protein n=1 Tax=Acinetobacter baumannii TaxID=470 RepID=UPI001BC87691
NHVGRDIPKGNFDFLNTARAVLDAYDVPLVAPAGFALVQRLLRPDAKATTAPKSATPIPNWLAVFSQKIITEVRQQSDWIFLHRSMFHLVLLLYPLETL